jgi:hypothetical protein
MEPTMKLQWRFGLGFVLAIAALVPSSGRLLMAQEGQKQTLPRSQMPDLGRPTKADDKMPVFDFTDYFVGSWKFEWDVPDSPLGPAGKITGTTVYKALGGKYYEARTEATGPSGKFTWTEVIGYEKEQKAVSRYVTDSRGMAYLQLSPIGGDLGGWWKLYFDGSPITFNGKTLRFKQNMVLLSPVSFKSQTLISVDGGPFVNYGMPWWHKDVPFMTSR